MGNNTGHTEGRAVVPGYSELWAFLMCEMLVTQIPGAISLCQSRGAPEPSGYQGPLSHTVWVIPPNCLPTVAIIKGKIINELFYSPHYESKALCSSKQQGNGTYDCPPQTYQTNLLVIQLLSKLSSKSTILLIGRVED